MPRNCHIDLALKNSHLNAADLLHINWSEDCSPKVLLHAVKGGCPAAVEWVYSTCFCLRTIGPALSTAAKNGNLKVVEWLWFNGHDPDPGSVLHSTIDLLLTYRKHSLAAATPPNS